jgi:hypothetical protein
MTAVFKMRSLRQPIIWENKMKRPTFVTAALAASLLPFVAAAQSDWPTKPVQLLCPIHRAA